MAELTGSQDVSIDCRDFDLAGYARDESAACPAAVAPSTLCQVQLDMIPLEQAGVTVSVAGVNMVMIPWGENPSATQCAIDFVLGRIALHSSAAGKTVRAVYRGAGTPASADLLNRFQKRAMAAIVKPSLVTPGLMGLDAGGNAYSATGQWNSHGWTQLGYQRQVFSGVILVNGVAREALITFNSDMTYTAIYTDFYTGAPKMARSDDNGYSWTDMGDVLTSGKRCSLVQNGNCSFTGLPTSDTYINPFHKDHGWSSVSWSGNTAFYALDEAVTAITAPTYGTSDPFPRYGGTAVGDKRIKILTSGRYKVAAWVRYQGDPATNANYTLRILKNRTIRGWWDGSRIYAGYLCISYTAFFDCSADDVIAVEFNNAAQASLIYVLASIEIEKIS